MKQIMLQILKTYLSIIPLMQRVLEPKNFTILIQGDLQRNVLLSNYNVGFALRKKVLGVSALVNCEIPLKVYISEIFFICLIEFIQCFHKESKKIFSIAIFLPRVLTCQKREILLPVSYKTALAKTEDWE